jgi:hypothetical protein
MSKLTTLLGLAALGGGVYYLATRKEKSVYYPSDRPAQCRELYIRAEEAARTYGETSQQSIDAYDAYLNCEEQYG